MRFPKRKIPAAIGWLALGLPLRLAGLARERRRARRLEREMSGTGSYVPVSAALRDSAARLAGEDPAGRQPKFLSLQQRRP